MKQPASMPVPSPKRLEAWTPFDGCMYEGVGDDIIRQRMQKHGQPRWKALMNEAYLRESAEFRNSRYFVRIHTVPGAENFPPLWHLAIRRVDGARPGPERYIDFMRIRDELVGPEHEGVEIYPARSREVNEDHVYHLFIAQRATDEFPAGFRAAGRRAQKNALEFSDAIIARETAEAAAA